MGKGWRRLIACVLLTFSVEASHAHPHIWVTMKCQIIFGADGSIVGVRHAWSFDEMSSAYITLGTGNGQKGVSLIGRGASGVAKIFRLFHQRNCERHQATV